MRKMMKCRYCGRVMQENNFIKTKGMKYIDICIDCKSELSKKKVHFTHKKVYEDIKVDDPDILELGVYCVQYNITQEDIDAYLQNKVQQKRRYFHGQHPSRD